MIYLDYTASTPVTADVEEIYIKALRECYANPSSVHSAGVAAAKRLAEARELLAKSVGCSAGEICFTSGGSESNNAALFGAARALKRRGSHIVSSLAEHDSVKAPLRALEKEGFEVTFVAPERDGSTDIAKIRAAVRPETVLVSLAAVNNETGAVNDIPALRAALSAFPTLIHSDCVQLIGKARHTQTVRAADLVSLCSHKLFAPKGAGALIIRGHARPEPLILGGGQESGRRSGTENLPAIIAFADAAARLVSGFAQSQPKVAALNSRLREGLSALGGVEFISGENAVPHILSFAVVGIPSETLVNYLSGEGILISPGSACKKGRKSEALASSGLPEDVLASAVRVSLSFLTTEREVDALVKAIASAKRNILHR
ncbi:MAG: cysteine desulfurase [Clostridia bacterium]|nr:cysteine desulfurase [Clostridia bacterium]